MKKVAGVKRWWFLGVLLVAVVSLVIYRYYSAPLSVTAITQPPTIEQQPTRALVWPEYGQSAVATKAYGVLETHGKTSPQATASTAKLITALAIMQKKPFSDSKGATIHFSQTDVDRYAVYLAGNGSVVPVAAGWQWSQYQALEAVLLASANNVSDSLAVWAFGSLPAYREYAQQMVRAIGMNNTTIGVDASGYSPTTTSTAHDLALLAAKVLEEPMLRQIVKQQTATLPGAGGIENTNQFLRTSEVIGMKTGYTPEAGGVFVLAGQQQIRGQTQDIITVVMGAPGETSGAAQNAAYRLYESAKANFSYQSIIKAGQQLGVYRPAWSSEDVPIVAKKDVGLFVWSGTMPTVQMTATALKPGSSGEIGTVAVVFRGQSQTAPLVVNSSITTPSWWWRVTGRG